MWFMQRCVVCSLYITSLLPNLMANIDILWVTDIIVIFFCSASIKGNTAWYFFFFMLLYYSNVSYIHDHVFVRFLWVCIVYWHRFTREKYVSSFPPSFYLAAYPLSFSSHVISSFVSLVGFPCDISFFSFIR